MTKRKTALDYVLEIDQKLEEAKRKGWQRMGIQWGTWSRIMNVQSTQDLSQNKNKKPDVNDLINRVEKSKLAVGKVNEDSFLVFKYWQNRSDFLEVYNSKSIFKFSKKYKLDREATKIKLKLFNI